MATETKNSEHCSIEGCKEQSKSAVQYKERKGIIAWYYFCEQHERIIKYVIPTKGVCESCGQEDNLNAKSCCDTCVGMLSSQGFTKEEIGE